MGKMKKSVISIIVMLFVIISATTIVNAVEPRDVINSSNTTISNNQEAIRAIDEETESQLIQLKENAAKSMEDYKEKYGSDVYGTVAYILNMIRIYSIPLCFLGIAIGAVHQYVIGVRKLDTLEKGLTLMVTFTTILIVCQILPLAFAVFVKFGRG